MYKDGKGKEKPCLGNDNERDRFHLWLLSRVASYCVSHSTPIGVGAILPLRDKVFGCPAKAKALDSKYIELSIRLQHETDSYHI